MKNKIRIGIVGYGNLGRGVQLAVKQNPDMDLVAIFTRRPVESINTYDKSLKLLNIDYVSEFVDDIDLMILCLGSSTDIPILGPQLAKSFNTVDAYDNHQNFSNYIRAMDRASRENNKTSATCLGWDPGLFSINRLLFESILPLGESHTFWGPGISQGHSNAIKKIPGVKKAVQYTIPNEESIMKIRKGENLFLSKREKHRRECYLVVDEGVDKDKIIEKVKNMPNYFDEYDTNIHFISEKELGEEHSQMHHGGFVIRKGETGEKPSNGHLAEFSLKLANNSEFTANVLLAYARAVHKLNKEGQIGAKTIFDIPLSYISPLPLEDLYKNFL